MQLKVLLPFGVFIEKSNVRRIVVETLAGSFGLLPHRLDCVAALLPGILMFADADEGEAFVAVDEGVLVKSGSEVMISVRRAVGGTNLTRLRDVVEKEFSILTDAEHRAREATEKLESGFLARFAGLEHE